MGAIFNIQRGVRNADNYEDETEVIKDEHKWKIHNIY